MSVVIQSGLTALVSLLVVVSASAQESADKQPVVLTGGAGVTRVWANEPVPFWLKIRNDGNVPLSQFQVRSLSADIVLQTICGAISAPGAAECVPVPQDIPAEEHITLRGSLVPLNAGNYRPVLLFAWTTPALTSESAALELGTVSAESYAASWASTIGGVIQGLTLPIVLAVLGYIYQRRLQSEQDKTRRQEAHLDLQRREQEADLERKRQERRQELERQRQEQQRQIEQARREREAERTQIAKTLTLMLPISHRYATQHYARLEVIARNLVQAVVRYRKKPNEDDALEGLYHFIRLYQRIRVLTRSEGAFYFKDRIGEEIVVAALEAYDNAMFRNYKEAALAISTVLDAVQQQPDLTLATFVNLRKPYADGVSEIGGSLVITERRFRDWIGAADADEGLGYLRAFRAVLNYEMNKPYAYWYGQFETLGEEDGLVETIRTLERTAIAAGKTELSRRFEQYLKTNAPWASSP